MSKSIRKSIFWNIISIFLCIAMFLGETYAWFTDVVQSTDNVIIAGNLDLELEYWNGTAWVDVEGKSKGIEKNLTTLIGSWGKIPVTYAGGVHSFEDLDLLKELGRDKLNVTIGSALDLFGGHMKWTEVMKKIKSTL